MAQRISFAEFASTLAAVRQKVARAGSEPGDDDDDLRALGAYLEFDPNSPLPRLEFRHDALIDAPPAGYDVDREIYLLVAAIQDARESAADKAPQKPRVVAEGDSWCMLPSFLPGVPGAVGNWIGQHARYRFKNIGRWGDTLESMLAKRQYIEEIAAKPTQYFLLIAGGNDLVDQLAAGGVLHQYDPNRPIDQYLTSAGYACLTKIQSHYDVLLSELRNRFPDLKTLCCGYDYPRPLLSKGKYIGKHLKKLGIPDSLADAIVRPVIELMGAKIEEAALANGARYVNCLNLTEPFTWWDDMHPHDDGFRALALRFEQAISEWP